MALQLYHVTVQVSGAIDACATCFFGSNDEYLVLARSQWLDVMQVVEDELVLRSRVNVFASVRCIERVPAQGGSSDTLALTSDAGDFVLLRYDPRSRRFSQLQSEPIGRSGFRRTTPGEYLAVDPKGRVALVAGIERLRMVYVLHPDGVSSIVEAHASSTFCYSLVAMDRGYGNPAFAFLERFRFGPKSIVMYEFNLGLNHLVKTWSHEVSEDTDILVAVPGGRDGPSGLIFFTGTDAIYLDPTSGKPTYDTAIPGPIICAQLVRVRRDRYFVFAQSARGECLVLTLTDDGIACKPCASLPNALNFLFLRSGHLFLNPEAGDQQLIQIAELYPLSLGDCWKISSTAPCISSSLQRKSLVLLNGTGDSSRISVLEYGKNTEELVSTPLPAAPTAVFAAKGSSEDAGHKIIALSFEASTTLLSVAEDGAVNESSEADTGLATKICTLGLHMMSDNALVQVHSSGFRRVAAQTTPWVAPKSSTVIGCAFTATQMLLALDTKQVLYFESRNGALAESKTRVDLSSAPTALCFETSLSSELTSTAFYVACKDGSIRRFSLPAIKQVKLLNPPSSVVSMQYRGTLHLGHENGTYSFLQDSRFWTRVLGSEPVRLSALHGETLIALSSRNWILSGTTATPIVNSAPKLEAVHPFITEDLPDGVLGISGPSLVVFTIPPDSTGFNSVQHDRVKFPSSMFRMARNSQANFWYASGAELLSLMQSPLVVAQDVEPVTMFLEAPSVACLSVRFDSQKRDALVVATKSKIKIYDYGGSPMGSELHLVHETSVDHCTAILPYKGMLLAAVSKTRLVLYDLGQKQLLRQGAVDLPDLAMIKVLRATRDRVFVGDSRRSVTVLSYDSQGFNILYRDCIPRCVTAMLVLDYVTVCIGDQYGNVAVLRCDTDPMELVSRSGKEEALQLVAHFRVPDGIVDLHRGVLSPVAGVEAIIYVGIQGTVGAFIPLTAKEDQAFMCEVQSEVNRRVTSLVGRNLGGFRGYYSPPKNVIDGDLCEYALSSNHRLDRADVEEIAEAVGSEQEELTYRIRTLRERSVF